MWGAFRDLIILSLPWWPTSKEYRYVFLVHPRDTRDIIRKYPFLRFAPVAMIEWLMMHFWPVIVGPVTGLRSKKSGKSIEGYVLAIPLTARQMMEHRGYALSLTRRAMRLAERHGAKIVGLGGLTSSISKGGLDLVDHTSINITTGHAYTAYNVTKNLFTLTDILGLDRRSMSLAIIGAAGSIGSTSALLAARDGYRNILLIDLERKHGGFQELAETMRALNPDVNIRFSHHVSDIREAHAIITATNAPEALVKSDDLMVGAVVIDDAQPSDISLDVLERDDVLAVEAGVVYTPGIRTHFDLGLKGRYDNFCCMSELLALASEEWSEHYVINRANLDLVDEISELGKKLGFKLAAFQNFSHSISPEKIESIQRIIRERGS